MMTVKYIEIDRHGNLVSKSKDGSQNQLARHLEKLEDAGRLYQVQGWAD